MLNAATESIVHHILASVLFGLGPFRICAYSVVGIASATLLGYLGGLLWALCKPRKEWWTYLKSFLPANLRIADDDGGANSSTWARILDALIPGSNGEIESGNFKRKEQERKEQERREQERKEQEEKEQEEKEQEEKEQGFVNEEIAVKHKTKSKPKKKRRKGR